MRAAPIVLVFIALMIYFSYPAFALGNSSSYDEASICLNSSFKILDDMHEKNLSTKRINEILDTAQQIFNAQKIMIEAGKNKTGDFSGVLLRCDEIVKLHTDAINALDQYIALKRFANEALTSDINMSEVNTVFYEIELEMQNERYDEALVLIDKGYSKISEIKASHTTLNLFYDATKNSVGRFFQRNWKPIAVFLSLIFLLFLAYRMQISKWLVKRKIKKLELRKDTLRNLIMEAQKEYFGLGKISEGIYHVRTVKFAEVIRDIERQIPLLKEDLARM